MKINKNYQNLQNNYLFATVAQKIKLYKENNPLAQVIRQDIGDVTLPLPAAIVTAIKNAADEMSTPTGFHGYGPYEGYDFLREPILSYYRQRNIPIELSDIFINEGAKSDIAHFLDILGTDNTVLIPDPVYPVYLDVNIIAGRKVLFANANAQNNFLPLPDRNLSVDIIYLCSPNNPTGAVYTHAQLQEWVDYANEQKALILFDAAYEAFVGNASLPRSIFEIPGARSCAVEFCSLSKTAGFTGVRCGYTIVPHELTYEGQRLSAMWLRHQSTKYNGVSFIIQKAAAAVFSAEGQLQVRQAIDYYMDNAKIIASTLDKLGIWYTGGINSPYIWLKCPDTMSSWDYFDYLLANANLSGTPGSGFGNNGNGFFRFTVFGNKNSTIEAMRKFESCMNRDFNKK